MNIVQQNMMSTLTYLNLWRNVILMKLFVFSVGLLCVSRTVGLKFYLNYVLLIVPVNMICLMTMFGKSRFLTPAPQVLPLEQGPGKRMKIPFEIFYIFYLWEIICEKMNKLLYRNLWNWLLNWNSIIFELWTPPQGPMGRGLKCVVAPPPPPHSC